MKVIFFLVLILNGRQPVPYQEEVTDLKECLTLVEEILQKPPANGALQSGCIVVGPAESKVSD